MAGKNTYRIGTDGSANFASLAAIPPELLTQQDTTFLIYPGTYAALTNAVLDDAAFIGLGDREEIVINGAFTIANTSANTTVFENITLVGPNATATSGSACVTKLGAASAPLRFRNVVFSNADFAVNHNGEGAFALLSKQVQIDNSDLSGVDRAVRANANTTVNFSIMNTSSNAYFTPNGGAGLIPNILVRASTSGGANTGNSTKTVLALVS